MSAVGLMPDDEGGLLGWTITRNPSDFPGLYVARRWVVRAGELISTNDIRTAETLDGVREQLPRGLVALRRNPTDDPVIVEVWI